MKDADDYIAMIRGYCGDPEGRRYSEGYVRTGMNYALAKYSGYLPLLISVTTKVIGASERNILLQWTPEPGQIVRKIYQSVQYDEIPQVQNNFVEERAITGTFLRFYYGNMPFKTGDQVVIEVATPHSIRDLNDAPNTTVPDVHSEILARGSAGYAMITRAAAVSEVFGKRPDDQATIQRRGEDFIAEFVWSLGELSTGLTGGPALPASGFGI